MIQTWWTKTVLKDISVHKSPNKVNTWNVMSKSTNSFTATQNQYRQHDIVMEFHRTVRFIFLWLVNRSQLFELLDKWNIKPACSIGVFEGTFRTQQAALTMLHFVSGTRALMPIQNVLHFQIQPLEWKFTYFNSHFTYVYSQEFN